MRFHLALGLLTATLTTLVSGAAAAATANCMSPDGSCEVNNDLEDSLICNCSDGSGGGMFGGMAWTGLSEMELQLICDDELAMFCGAPPPPPGIPCGTANGDCVISNNPEDFIECSCVDGSSFGFGGGNAWAGLSDMDLVGVCESIVDMECAGAPPPPPPPPPVALECSGDLGACTITNDPEDFIECACANGMGFAGGGGMDWSGLSDEDLLMVCEEQLAEGCSEGGATEGTTGEPGETEGGSGGGEGTGGGGTGGAGESTGGEGLDTGGISEGGSTGTEPGEGTTSGGEGATDGETDGATGGADDGGGSKGCSVAGAPAPGWALVLLGLWGVGRRRRRAA